MKEAEQCQLELCVRPERCLVRYRRPSQSCGPCCPLAWAEVGPSAGVVRVVIGWGCLRRQANQDRGQTGLASLRRSVWDERKTHGGRRFPWRMSWLGGTRSCSRVGYHRVEVLGVDRCSFRGQKG